MKISLRILVLMLFSLTTFTAIGIENLVLDEKTFIYTSSQYQAPFDKSKYYEEYRWC